MKRILTFCLVAMVCIANGFAKQKPLTDYIHVKGTLKETYESIPKGSPVLIKQVLKVSDSQQYPSGIYYLADIGGQQIILPKAHLNQIRWEPPQNLEDFWQYTFLTCHLYEIQAEKEETNEQRREIEQESLEYLEHLQEIVYEDAYTASYVQGIVAKLCGSYVSTNRNGNVNALVIQAPEPVSFMLPTGNIIVSTGLLCTLDSEAELTAILASEIGHYLYDHQVNNVRRNERRAQRALFWANIFDAVAYGLAEDYYYNGYSSDLKASFTANIGTIVALLCVPAIDRLGMDYTSSQEQKADEIAFRLLDFNGYPADALTSALRKIRNYYDRNIQPENILRYHSIKDLQKRLEDMPEPAPKTEADHGYLKSTYDIVNFNADLNYAAGLYKEACMLAQKNIDNRLADSQTYVILVRSKMALENTETANNECLSLLDKADEANPGEAPNLDVCKQRILLLMRMQKQSSALPVLQNYLDVLTSYKEQQPADREERMWIDKETNWAVMMIRRINKL